MSTTLPLTVKEGGLGFLVDRLGQDCSPLQFIRELTQNGIEALIRHGLSGELIWDIDEMLYDATGQHKLCIIDTGIGMSKEELVNYINQLSSSGGIQSITANYGMGAKIAAATKNPEGVIYQSWKNGKGYMIHFYKDHNGSYGLKQLSEDPNNKFVAELDNVLKPKCIVNHGTKVILLGGYKDDNTMIPPAGTPTPSKWLAYYLNTRYFRITNGVTIKCREGWEFVFDRKSGPYKTREVTGMYSYLEKEKMCSGSVKLTGATARWWVLNDDRPNVSEIYRNGHVAAIYQNELYDFKCSRSGRAALQEFGILFSMVNVVIYVEPDTDFLTTDTARTTLKLSNAPLPWSDWAREFRDALPQELIDIQLEEHNKASSEDIKKSIAERMNKIADLYKMSIYRSAKSGIIPIYPDIGGEFVHTNMQQAHISTTDMDDRANAPNLPKPKIGNDYSKFIKPSGPYMGVDTKYGNYPEVLRIEDPENHDLVDYGAVYISSTNQIKVNMKFTGFQSLAFHYMKGHGDNEIVRKSCIDSIYSWYSLSLVDLVVGTKSIPGWSEEEVSKTLSREVMTAVCMQRYFQYHPIKRDLGAKMGASKA